MTSLKSIRKHRQQLHAREVRGLVAFCFCPLQEKSCFPSIFNVQTMFTPISRLDKHAELFVFMSEIKIDLTLKKSNFLFLLCFKIAKIMFITMRQQSRQRNSFFSSRFTSNLMLPACLLGVILVVNEVCN